MGWLYRLRIYQLRKARLKAAKRVRMMRRCAVLTGDAGPLRERQARVVDLTRMISHLEFLEQSTPVEEADA